MEFFSSVIDEFSDLVGNCDAKQYFYKTDNVWRLENYSHIILQRDTACELDGTGFNIFTSANLESGVVVIGNDLSALREKNKFSRVCIVKIDDSENEQNNYNLIRKIDYIKYHFFPEGYMIRTSSRAHKEGVRVSDDAIRNGISFEKIGNSLINMYLENPAVRAVKVYFITEKSADYNTLEAMAQKCNDITETFNHVMNSINFDCNTCKLKPVCDEVEGMKELHFKNVGNGM